MIYVFDTGPLILMFRHYYPERFPSLWGRFDSYIQHEVIISVSEVARELNGHEDSLSQWGNDNQGVFLQPSPDELIFIREIFEVPHFQDLIRRQERLEGRPVADPFVIAKAKLQGGCVITTEKHKPHSSKIPNVCNHFGVQHMSLEEFMTAEDWVF